MHRCVRCGNVYEDNDATILRGCTKCGAIFFLYIKSPEDVKQVDAVEAELQKKETTLEKELIREIGKRKAEEKVLEKPEEKIAIEVKERVERPIKIRPIKRPKRPKREVVKIGKTRFAVEDLFGIETIRVPKDGVYEINIDALMKKKPIIVLERGKVYFIHLPSVFERTGKS